VLSIIGVRRIAAWYRLTDGLESLFALASVGAESDALARLTEPAKLDAALRSVQAWIEQRV
jgi:hypothetical protein